MFEKRNISEGSAFGGSFHTFPNEPRKKKVTLRLHGMSWGVKTTCFKGSGVSLGGSGVSIGGVRSLRVLSITY